MICRKCNTEKQDSEFYAKDRTCKECRKARVRENRSEKVNYYREYDKKRANLPHRVEARLKYSQTDEGKKSATQAKKRWAESNIVKRSANLIVGNAVRDGKIIKPNNCENCGTEHVRIHGHHDDYAYPMVVRWLCPKCHCAWHKENCEALNG